MTEQEKQDQQKTSSFSERARAEAQLREYMTGAALVNVAVGLSNFLTGNAELAMRREADGTLRIRMFIDDKAAARPSTNGQADAAVKPAEVDQGRAN